MILDIYSKRIDNDKGSEIFTYDEVPQKIRMQVYYIVKSMNYKRDCGYMKSSDIWHDVRDILLNEYGLETLAGQSEFWSEEECLNFIKTTGILGLLDIIEVALFCKKKYNKDYNIEFIEDEINHRFLENNLGYEIINKRVVRIDRKFTHEKIVKPAINLLYEDEFKSANDEFLAAHSFYREAFKKDNPNEYLKNAIINCNKAFESTMKIICEKNREKIPGYNDKHTASELINDLIDGGIIPNYLGNEFHGIRNIFKGIKATLENGLPVIRNKSGHGLGNSEEAISEEYVTYAMNLAATNIVLLVNLYKNN